VIVIHGPGLARSGMKGAFTDFIARIAAVMGPEFQFLNWRSIELHVWVGRIQQDPRTGFLVAGRAHAKQRLNDARNVEGKPLRYRLHLAEAILCNPTELATTIVHEMQHVRDLSNYFSMRYGSGDFPKALVAERMEQRAEEAERRFWMRTTHAQVRAQHAVTLGRLCA
jgi:hypothetical protein